MAQVFKRPGSPSYYARFQIGGQDYCLSTKKSTKAEAEKELVKLIAKKSGSLSVDEHFQHLLRMIEELPNSEQDAKRQAFSRRILAGSSKKIAFEDAWDAWLASPMKRNPGAGTIAGYGTQWKRFKTWARDNDLEYLHEVFQEHAETYAADLWQSNVAPGTYNQHIGFLKSIFRVLRIQAGIAVNPWEEIPRMELEREGRRELTPDELATVCARATGNLRYMFGLGLYTGMRLSDVVHLKWSEVDFDKGIIVHIPAKTRRKNKKVRLPIHPVLDSLLRELRKTSTGTYLFSEEKRSYDKEPGGVSKRIQKHFKDCGIETLEQPKNGHRKRAIVRVGFHSLRHSFVSLCAANRVPQVAIMDLVGHGSPAMTALYSHAGDEQKKAAVIGLPDIVFPQGVVCLEKQ